VYVRVGGLESEDFNVTCLRARVRVTSRVVEARAPSERAAPPTAVSPNQGARLPRVRLDEFRALSSEFKAQSSEFRARVRVGVRVRVRVRVKVRIRVRARVS